MADTTPAFLRKRYRLKELIGRGGSASVFRAHDESLGRDVAIKLYPPTTDSRDAKRQEDEVAVLASLSHHNLVTLLDAGVDRIDDGRRVYIVMELVTGLDLQQTIARRSPTPQDIAHIGYDMAEALQYIHHRGVVHRDIKPSNILMVDYRDDGTRARAKLTDFGIAQHAASRVFEEGVTTGTAAYLSPEQVRRAAVGPASDTYSLGLVLLECFTGELAYPGEPVASALARLDDDPRVPDSVPAPWREILTAMTSIDPNERPGDAQLVESMRRLMVAETERVTIPFPSDNPELNLDRISRMAARVLDVPIAIVRVGERVWFTPWLVENTRLDPLTLTSEDEARASGLRFYAGVPIVGRDGRARGRICALAFEARELSADDETTLNDLASMVLTEIEARIDGGQVRQSA
ncbi:hypothetical protein BH11ACT2_BH11ACT2_13050 [soil metagenome]